MSARNGVLMPDRFLLMGYVVDNPFKMLSANLPKCGQFLM